MYSHASVYILTACEYGKPMANALCTFGCRAFKIYRRFKNVRTLVTASLVMGLLEREEVLGSPLTALLLMDSLGLVIPSPL